MKKKEKDEEAPKLSAAHVESILIDILQNRPPACSWLDYDEWEPPSFQLRIVRSGDPEADPIVLKLKYSNENHDFPTATRVSMEDVAALLTNYLEEITQFSEDARKNYFITHKKALGIVEAYKRRAMDGVLSEMPKAVAFRSDPELAMERLDFDPEPCEFDRLKKLAPIFMNIQMGDDERKLFLARLGSLLSHGIQRRQCLFIYGPGGAGKLVLEMILRYLMGEAYYPCSAEQLAGEFGKEPLIGKRTVVVQEADAKFLTSPLFKSLTGDKYQTANRKNKPFWRFRCDATFWFFSNEPPAIADHPELVDRVIPIELRRLPEDLKIPEADALAGIRSELKHVIGAGIKLFDEMRNADGTISLEDSVKMRQLAEKAIDRYESDDYDFLYSHFDFSFFDEEQNTSMDLENYKSFAADVANPMEADPFEHWVSCDDFRKILTNNGYRRGQDQKRIVDLMMRKFPVLKQRVGRVGGKKYNRYLGVKIESGIIDIATARALAAARNNP
jgi:hypothetical protein